MPTFYSVPPETDQLFGKKNAVAITSIILKICHGALHSVGIDPKCRPLKQIISSGRKPFPTAILTILPGGILDRLPTSHTTGFRHTRKFSSTVLTDTVLFFLQQFTTHRTFCRKKPIKKIQKNTPPFSFIIAYFSYFCILFFISRRFPVPPISHAKKNNVLVRIYSVSCPSPSPDFPQW